jgi:hypothetical protein
MRRKGSIKATASVAHCSLRLVSPVGPGIGPEAPLPAGAGFGVAPTTSPIFLGAVTPVTTGALPGLGLLGRTGAKIVLGLTGRLRFPGTMPTQVPSALQLMAVPFPSILATFFPILAADFVARFEDLVRRFLAMYGDFFGAGGIRENCKTCYADTHDK